MMMSLKTAFLVSASAVLALEWSDGTGKLPALGWNSWNAYHCDINETRILDAANAIVKFGFKDAGYEYVNIDDCWSVKTGRDRRTQQLVPDPKRFPSGISGVANKIHALGLKIGIYSSAGTRTCAGYPASIGYESIDAATWAAWGIDYLKYDNCNVPSNWTDACNACVYNLNNPNNYVNGTCVNSGNYCPGGYDYTRSNSAKRYAIMRDALQAQNRTIQYALCSWGSAGVEQYGNATGNSWRMSDDIQDGFKYVTSILNMNSFNLNDVDFWGHPDADMLEVGNGGLSVAEERTHFAFWAAMKSPLLIGTNLYAASDEAKSILLNKYLLAFNQDNVYGAPAKPWKWGTNPDFTFNATNPAEFWSGESQQGTLVLMMNTLAVSRDMTANFGEIPSLDADGSYKVLDVWTGEDLGSITSSLTVKVASHDTAAFLFTSGLSQ
ncbi:glycoside hydrolase family 27 protein [Xylaria bambusicola]|uniref:glycoside hydrolase family 27 protein n=1 Tax=Xylaria bambusicola TaxID=326684 RepID=UPI002007A272|nr:glycoside hydrolase family 27 protein [Xylaria bambusicola]KAI0525355.1 glycoside hydrolase family 27 protein [Xylaria bambusicola]